MVDFTILMRKSTKWIWMVKWMVFAIYRSNQIIRAEKYIMGKKTKEWNLVTKKTHTNFYE
jgi:hypothetical protein